MSKRENKNLFGMTVTALDNTVVSCAHLEPIDGGSAYPNGDQTGKTFNWSPVEYPNPFLMVLRKMLQDRTGTKPIPKAFRVSMVR